MAQGNFDTMVERENVLLAETHWVLKVVQSRYSQRSCDNINELFQVLFPGCKIIEKFSCGRAKCGYIINHSFALYFVEGVKI